MKNQILIGPHLSVANGFVASIDAAESIGATVAQIFTKSNRSWFAPGIDPQEAKLFQARLQKSTVAKFFVHACYLINLASSNPEVAKKSVLSLRLEMQRCADLGIKNLILHPGAHTGQGTEAGIAQIVVNLNSILENDKTGTRILLENMAGQGSNIGSDLTELAAIYSRVAKPEQVGFCLDTCHLFAASYDLVSNTGFANTMQAIEENLGFDKILAIQLNDSKFDCGSKKDRHENLGLGKIGIEGLSKILQHPQLQKLPLLLETPDLQGLPGYAAEIKLVEKLINQK